MQNKNYSILITSLILFISASPAFALTIDDITPRGQSSQVLGVSTTSLLGQIEQAKQMLGQEKLNYVVGPTYTNKKITTGKGKNKKTINKQILSGYTVPLKDIALAILDPNTNQIKITKAMQRDTEFQFPDKNFIIEKVRFNGVNTRFKVYNPAGGVVLALKYLITKDATTKQGVNNNAYEGIYVPYSQELQTDEVSQAGNEYLINVIKLASNQLNNTPSVSSPGQTIATAIRPELIRALLYAEHMDTWEFNTNPNTQELVNKVNVLLGSNTSDTWKYSVSSAGAAGISQFIPSTYTSLVKRHKDQNLIPDFVTAMRNHVNAVKSTYLLLDDYIAAVRDRTPENFLPGHAFSYGVAAYNGGTVRVAKAATAYGPRWAENQTNKENSLREETIHYVEKINRLIQLFNNQPTLQ